MKPETDDIYSGPQHTWLVKYHEAKGWLNCSHKSLCRLICEFQSQRVNARIWMWENDGLVKITLKPGQRREWSYFHRDEEGYSKGGFILEWDGYTLTQTWGSTATDCDGRLERGGVHTTTPDQFRGHQWLPHPDTNGQPCDCGHCLETARLKAENIAFPLWTTTSTSQRDYAAEAAGY